MDLSTFASVLAFLQAQGYTILFLFMIIEGTIITAVAAFASSLGLFDVYTVFLLSVLGGIIGDLIYYFLGRIGRKTIIDRYFEKFSLKKKTIETIERHLHNHPGKALTLIKIIPPLPMPGLMLAGVVHLPLKKFIFFSSIISFFYSLFFTLIGFYLGVGITHILNAYSKYVAAVGIIPLAILALIGICVLYVKFSEKLFTKI